MLQYNPTVSGSLTITGSLTVTNGVIGTVSGVDVQIFSSSINQVISGIQSSTESSDARLTFIETFTSSALTRLTNIESKSASVDISISNINSITASNIARLSNLETKSSSVDISISSINTFTSSNAIASLNSKTGSYATTGSNSFYGTQVFSGSVYIANDLVVQGSSSIQYISASSVSIGTNIVQLNTATPSVRFAGLSVQDSGSSAGVTGSMLWDSLCNRWIYSNPSTIGYSGGMLMSGPRASTLGSETPLTCNYIAKSGGGDHLYDSAIYENNGNIGLGTTSLCNTYTVTIEGSGSASTKQLYLKRQGSDQGLFISAGSGDVFYNSYDGNNIVYGRHIFQSTKGTSTCTRLSIDETGVSCFANTICIPNLYMNGGIINQQSGDLSFWVPNVGQALTIQQNTGKVGIGCTSPTYGLEVRCAASTTCCWLAASFSRTTGASDGIGDIISFGANGVSSIAGMYRSGGGSWGLELQTANQNTRMRIDNSGISCFACQLCAPVAIFSGCVGIGTTVGTAALGIGGNDAQTTANLTDAGTRKGILEIIPVGGTAGYGGALVLGSDTWGTGAGRGQIALKALLTDGSGCGVSDLAFSLRNNSACSNLTERMRITSGGYVGIGTCTPNNSLQVLNSQINGGVYNTNSSGDSIGMIPFQRNNGSDFFGLSRNGQMSIFAFPSCSNVFSIGTQNASDMIFGTNGVERVRVICNGNVSFSCSVNFNGNGNITSKNGGVYNGTTTVTIGPVGYNGVMQIMVGVYGNGSGNTGRAMWLGGGYIGSGMPFTEVTRYCAGAVTIGTLNANAGCYTFTVGYSFPNSADISVTVIGTNANTAPATISFG